MSQCCLVCNGRMGVKQRLATNIFKEKTTSGKGLSDVLSEILDKSLPATALYSDVICKRCHRTCSEYEAAKERIQQLKSDLISQFKATLPNHNLSYETIWETKSPKDGNTDRRVGKRVVLPASKLQPLPPDYVIDVTKLASGLVSNKATKITNTITPVRTNSMKTSPKTSSFKPTKMQDLVTNIIQDITQSSSDTKSLSFNVDALPKDILASAVLAKLNSNINEKKDVGASDSMEIDEDCTPVDVSDELQDNSNASQSEFHDLAASDSEGRSAGDELELRELRVLNDEDEDDEETIVMSAENGSILRVVRGQTLVYKGGKMALRDGSEPADDPEQDAGNESNDDSQIELQVSGDEETANAIIAAAQEKGGAFIKVESGEMFRVKSVRSKTEAEPTTTVKEPPPIVERDGDIFKCLICENIGKGAECRTRDPSEIARHARACHRARVYVCSRCYAVSRRHDAHIAHTKQCWKHKEKHSKTPTEKRVHECDICLKTYNSRALLAEHANVHSGARPYACPACAKKFASKYTLQAHLKTHQDRPRPYQCSLCLKTFLTTTNLKQHENTHSSDRHFVCTECGKAFASQHSLEVHGVVHSGSKPFVCGVCGKAFARRAEVRDHMRTHTGERPFECEQCGASFAQRSNLHTHRRATHMNDRPYHCAHCDKRFKRRRLLEYHIKATHTGERPLECEVCHATFVYPEHYKKHVRGHSGERPFECEVCGKTFNSRDNRNTHRFVHSDKKPYECLVCGAGYMRKQLLYAHMNTSGHLAESIVVNQPRVQVTETAVTSVPSEIVDSIKINPDNTESAVLQLNAENDKPIDTSKVNLVQGNDDPLLLSIHTPSDITKSEPGAMQEITLDPTQMVATTEGGSVMRLVQIQLENGASGWVAINE